jgi:hypothetical protein
MRQSLHMTTERCLWRVFPVLLFLLALVATPAPAWASPKCLGPYTLTSNNNYAPDQAGDDVRDWWGDFTVNLVVTSGTVTLSVEAKLDGGEFASLGTMSTTSIAQFHGPPHRLHFFTTACSSCNATVIACAAKGE